MNFFQEGIDEKRMCTHGEYSINIERHRTIAARNHRVPIYWEKEIIEEISALFNNRIISKSKTLDVQE